MSDLVGNPKDRFSRVAAQIRGLVQTFCHKYFNFVNKHERLTFNILIEGANFLAFVNLDVYVSRVMLCTYCLKFCK